MCVGICIECAQFETEIGSSSYSRFLRFMFFGCYFARKKNWNQKRKRNHHHLPHLEKKLHGSEG